MNTDFNPGEKVSRRDFVGWVIKGGLLAAFSSMLFPALQYILPATRRGPATGMKQVARLDDIPVWGSKKVILGGSALILIRTQDQVKAFSAVCTHLGCLVDWEDKKRAIHCPCHAGLFDMDGRVMSGPPPRPLPSYPVKVMGGNIFVEI